MCIDTGGRGGKSLSTLFVAVNTGGLGYTERAIGAAQLARGRRLGRAPNAALAELLRWAEAEVRQGDRKVKKHACFILSETKTSQRDLAKVRGLLHERGYATVETHGALGRVRERGGVMVAWDHRQLTALPVGAKKRNHRVVIKGRVIRMSFAQAPARGGEGDIDLVASYMPPRGSGGRGHADPVEREDVSRKWKFLQTKLAGLQQRGRIVWCGDFNAETSEMVRRRRAGGAAMTPSDVILHETVNHQHLVRPGELEATYLQTSPTHAETIIDHCYISQRLQSGARGGTSDGLVRTGNRHKAIWLALSIGASATIKPGPSKPTATKLCNRNGATFGECIGGYRALIDAERGQVLGWQPGAATLSRIQRHTQASMETAVGAKRRPDGQQRPEPEDPPRRVGVPRLQSLRDSETAIQQMLRKLMDLRRRMRDSGSEAQPGEVLRLGRNRVPDEYRRLRTETELTQRIAGLYSATAIAGMVRRERLLGGSRSLEELRLCAELGMLHDAFLEVERQIRRELDKDHSDYYAGKLEEAAQRGPDEIMTTVYAIVSHSASGVVGKGGSGGGLVRTPPPSRAYTRTTTRKRTSSLRGATCSTQ